MTLAQRREFFPASFDGTAALRRRVEELEQAQKSHASERAMSPEQFYGPGGRGYDGGRQNGSKFVGALNNYTTLWDQDTDILRDRSRTTYWDSPQARGILGRFVDNAIGTGLSLQSSPMWEIIQGDGDPSDAMRKKRYKVKRQIDTRFGVYATTHEADASDKRTLYELQILELLNRFRDGETFIVYRYSDDPKRISPLSIQFYRPEQIVNPTSGGYVEAAKAAGNHIECGIELDSAGREIAIFVQAKDRTITRIPFYSPETGRRFVSHPMIYDTPGQVRGTPMLASVVHELQKITDGKVAELEAMVINALLAVWVKPGPEDKASDVAAKIAALGQASQNGGSPATRVHGSSVITMKPGIVVPPLKAGEEMHSFDTARPNLDVNAFTRGILKDVTSSFGMGIETAELEFNTAYTAARASLLAFWTKVEMWRDSTASQFLNEFYEAWFELEIQAGRLSAKGFDTSPLIRRAWLSCTWLGSSMPSIDPLKEVSAVKLRQELGHTTGQREAMKYNNSDFAENVATQKPENEALAEARAPLFAMESGIVTTPGPDGEDQISVTAPSGGAKTDPAQLKLEFDAYGVGVRAGVFTPQPDDEAQYRKAAGLPPMSKAVKEAWEEEGNVRRPITLTPPSGQSASAPGAPAQNEDSNPEDAVPED